jgi:nucleotide-binding universal stress UspA family protein
MLRIRTILHATDFSEDSNHAFRLAHSLARDHGARLIVAHVIPESRVPSGGVLTPPPSEEYEEARENLAKIRSNDSRVLLKHRLLVGAPAEEICLLARDIRAGLIVMGTHGRSGLKRLLMGSVAEQVVRQAPCPVLTVRVPVRIIRRSRRKTVRARSQA